MTFNVRDFSVGPDGSLWEGEGPLPELEMQLLAGADRTEGRFTLIRYKVSTEVFRHVHENEDESIYLMDGEITVTVGDRPHHMEPGSFVFMPRGVPHSIVSHDGPWKGLSVSSPGGPFQECMEELLAFRKAGNPFSMEALVEIQEKHGVRNLSDSEKWWDQDSAK